MWVQTCYLYDRNNLMIGDVTLDVDPWLFTSVSYSYMVVGEVLPAVGIRKVRYLGKA
jgi:hypothetical protein